MVDNTHVLIVDDEPDIRELLALTLTRMHLSSHAVDGIEAAIKSLKKNQYQLCLTDMRLLDGDGISLVRHVQKYYPQMPIAVITAHGNMDIAIEALKAGAFDFVSKPIELSYLRGLVDKAIQLSQIILPKEFKVPLLGQSKTFKQLEQHIHQVARSQAPVHVSGESGTGKELVARMIHYAGSRASGPFVPVNCGAIPSELVESEFFGHVKGSFTGAVEDKQGLFQAAHGGTLFLDEVADLPISMQVKLLRAIQEKKIKPVGSHKEIAVDIRIISATHKDLLQLVQDKTFRQDLFYRIHVVHLHVPALRERREDIPLLVDYFLQKMVQGRVCHFSLEATQALQAYSFPGNIRELENIIERALIICHGNTIKVEDLQLPIAPVPSMNADLPEMGSGFCLEDYLADVEKKIILKTLTTCRWNRTVTAKRLGISFRALRYRLEKLGINEDERT